MSEHLAGSIKNKVCDKDEITTTLKSFTANGYKQVTIMCFGESAPKISRVRPGTII